MEPLWRQTAQYGKVAYSRVEVASAKLVAMRSEWPEELRWALDLFLASPSAEGIKALYTPRFIIASKRRDKLLHSAHGYRGWTDFAKPWLDKHVGA